MAEPLRTAFSSELHLEAGEAETFARLARERLPSLVGSSEDTEEDLVVRLRDPRVFGAFAEPLLRDPRLSEKAQLALAEHAFDLLPLPRGEGDVILVEARTPPRLLAIAAFLASEGAFSPLHLMHLVYAVFLDRALLTGVDPRVRSSVLFDVLRQTESPKGLRVLYAGMHLAAVPGTEAHRGLRGILASDRVPADVKHLLASVVSSPDGGRTILADLAREEGLIPADAGPDSAEVLSNVPRLPERLAALGRRCLRPAGH